jgi:hypothetical protein
MEPHSILVCVDGIALESEKEAVAKAIFDNKPCGTGYTRAANSKTYTESGAGDPSAFEYAVKVIDAYGNPYFVYFCKPIPLAINSSIVVQNRNYTGVDLVGDVQNAVASWAAEHNFGCGEPVYASDVIKAIESAVSGVVVVECHVGAAGADKFTSYVEVDAVHKASFNLAEVSIFSR